MKRWGNPRAGKANSPALMGSIQPGEHWTFSLGIGKNCRKEKFYTDSYFN